MNIRLNEKNDRFDAGVISLIAFHGRSDDLEKDRNEWEASQDEDWGAFDDDGTMMARIVNNHFDIRFDGRLEKGSGIGGVSTLPEYRESGAVRAIFKELLPKARENGMVFSGLYPFSHAFYRKFGYETVSYKTVYTFKPSVLSGHHHDGFVRQWRPGDDVSLYTAIYDKFSRRYNLAQPRTDEQMTKRLIRGEFHKDRYFVYLLGKGSAPYAYVAFQDTFRPESALLSVKEAAYTCPEGFRAVLGFLSRFSADYGDITLPLPTDIDLRHFVNDPYAVQANPVCDHMIRVLNTEKVLSDLRKPAGCDFIIRIEGDREIPENNGTWHVRGDSVAPSADTPDLILPENIFAQLSIGASDLYEASLRKDVRIADAKDCLFETFTKKPIYLGDFF